MINFNCLLDDALVLEGLDHCVLGYSDSGVLIYSHELLVGNFMADGMTYEEAVEWVDYNILGLTNNGAGFIVCYKL